MLMLITRLRELRVLYPLIVLVLLLVVCTACGGQPNLEGDWSGNLSGQNGEAGSIQLSLEQDGDTITGNGEIRENDESGGEAIFLSVDGGSVQDDGSVALEVTSDGSQPVRITGQIEGDTLDGTFQTTGGDLPMTLQKEN